jgi:hypothetical protein
MGFIHKRINLAKKRLREKLTEKSLSRRKWRYVQNLCESFCTTICTNPKSDMHLRLHLGWMLADEWLITCKCSNIDNEVTYHHGSSADALSSFGPCHAFMCASFSLVPYSTLLNSSSEDLNSNFSS